jgi:hypothetical protein
MILRHFEQWYTVDTQYLLAGIINLDILEVLDSGSQDSVVHMDGYHSPGRSPKMLPVKLPALGRFQPPLEPSAFRNAYSLQKLANSNTTTRILSCV